MKRIFQNKSGFTLIELVVVALLVVILTSIGLPQYTRSLKRARSSEGLAQGKMIFDSAVRYRAETGGSGPDTFNVLDVTLEYDGDLDTNTITMGDFTYTLESSDLAVAHSEDGYTFKFNYPEEKADGVYADILCCPGSNDICKNMGNTAAEGGCLKVR